MTVREQNNAELRYGYCFNCLDNHTVCNCDKDNNFWRCRDSSFPKHFDLLHQTHVLEI